jgi:hypothetical protein
VNQLWDMAATLARKAFVMLTGPKFVQPVLSVLILCAVVELVTQRRWRRYLTRVPHRPHVHAVLRHRDSLPVLRPRRALHQGLVTSTRPSC